MQPTSRGIRNNNPGNIRHSGSRWKGLRPNQTDVSFCQFEKVEHGVRALIITLRTYVTKYRLTSVYEIIQRYAPQSDGNATVLYVRYVSKRCNVPDPHVSYLSSSAFKLGVSGSSIDLRLFYLCRAICELESGYILTYRMFEDVMKHYL